MRRVLRVMVWLSTSRQAGCHDCWMGTDATRTDAMTPADRRALQEVAAALGAQHVADIGVITEGLMNRNWRVTTSAGTYAATHITDVDVYAARDQHRPLQRWTHSVCPYRHQ
jgi:hypothetical protein